MTAAGRAAALAAVLWSACSCGGALGFITPATRRGFIEVTPWRTNSEAGKASRGVPTTQSATRPRAPPPLRSSNEPKPGGGSIADALAATEVEMSTEEKIAALQREVQSQVLLADETEANMAPEEIAAMEKENMKDLDESEVEALGFNAGPEFIDEGKNIIWPDTRRVVQLTVLAVVAQIAFIGYILGLNAFLNTVPVWWGKLVEVYKAGSLS